MIKQFLKSKLWKWLAINIFGKLTFRVSGYPTFPMDEVFKMVKLFNPNNVYAFVSKDKKSFSYTLNKLFTGADWSHAGIITGFGDLECINILHVTSKGVLYETILALLREVDEFAIVQLYATNTAPLRQHIERFKLLIGQDKYDFAFDLSTEDKFYCSELVFRVVEGMEMKSFKASNKLGGKAFTPDDVYKYGRVVYEYRSK